MKRHGKGRTIVEFMGLYATLSEMAAFRKDLQFVPVYYFIP